jgi:hypothetical protein
MKPTQATSWITEAHFEPYLAEADGDHDDMLKLATLIDPDARAWIEKVSRVSAVLGDRP